MKQIITKLALAVLLSACSTDSIAPLKKNNAEVNPESGVDIDFGENSQGLPGVSSTPDSTVDPSSGPASDTHADK